MASTQQFWAPIPTTIISSTPIDNASAAENISTFLQIHHGELPGDSNATASLVRLIQGLRDDTKSSLKTETVAITLPEKKKKKRKHDKLDADASIVADATTEPAVDESVLHEGAEPAKKKKKKDKKRKEAKVSEV